MGIKKTYEKVSSFFFDRIWSHHICGLLFLALTGAAVGVVLGVVIPIWNFLPVTSNCLVTSKTREFRFKSSTYVTFKKYRISINVNYTTGGGQLTSSTVYGPVDQELLDIKERGYSLSLFVIDEFAAYYQINQTYPCYYRVADPKHVTFSMSGHYYWLTLLPIPFLFIAILFCCYPTCAKWWLKRRSEKKLMAEFMKYDKMRTESQQQERSMFMDTKSNLIKDDADDEEPYQIDTIEQIGDFFGTKPKE
eukprot:gene8992-1091_t